jgi:predicted nucleotidyltransferase/DNA-binding HxlR family transcriptional regulator
MPSIAAHLLGQTRSAVLAALLLRPDVSLHVRELARLTGVSAGSLHRELRLLAGLGLLVRQEIGRQVHYRANEASPIFAEVAGLLRKTAGLVDVLRDALMPLDGKVSMAFVYGSVAGGTERPSSDVDVMVLGSAGFAEVVRALASAHTALRREVNPTVMSAREFAQRLAVDDGFARSVAKGERLWLIGSEDDFVELAADRKAQGTRAHARRGAAPSRSHRPQRR